MTTIFMLPVPFAHDWAVSPFQLLPLRTLHFTTFPLLARLPPRQASILAVFPCQCSVSHVAFHSPLVDYIKNLLLPDTELDQWTGGKINMETGAQLFTGAAGHVLKATHHRRKGTLISSSATMATNMSFVSSSHAGTSWCKSSNTASNRVAAHCKSSLAQTLTQPTKEKLSQWCSRRTAHMLGCGPLTIHSLTSDD